MALLPPKLGYCLTWQLHRNLRGMSHASYRIKPTIFNPLVSDWKWEYLWGRGWSIRKALMAKALKENVFRLGYKDDLKDNKTAPEGLTARISTMCFFTSSLPSSLTQLRCLLIWKCFHLCGILINCKTKRVRLFFSLGRIWHIYTHAYHTHKRIYIDAHTHIHACTHTHMHAHIYRHNGKIKMWRRAF